MTRVNFIQHDGAKHQIDTEDGYSLMEVAINNNISGIDGDCGGVCACATCHVYVDEAWTSKLGERTAMEADMLELAADVTERSRLACQIKVETAVDGLTVHLPESQH